tara:strand:- start:1092 stop:1451 length:360 start_codon:yes stop_codon:yes gene_type:complete
MSGKGILLAHTAPPRQDQNLTRDEHAEICKQYLKQVHIKWMGTAKMYVGKDAKTDKRIAQLDYITGPNSMAQKFIDRIAERRYKVEIYHFSPNIHTWIDINSPLAQNLNVQSEGQHALE